MGSKAKLSVTIDTEILEALDKASRDFRIAKSRLTQEALELWFRTKTEALMAQGYEEMAREDKAFAELTFEAQKEALT